MLKSMAARFEQKNSFQNVTTSQLKTNVATLIRISGGAVSVLRSRAIAVQEKCPYPLDYVLSDQTLLSSLFDRVSLSCVNE
jgi:hypothetical protein